MKQILIEKEGENQRHKQQIDELKRELSVIVAESNVALTSEAQKNDACKHKIA